MNETLDRVVTTKEGAHEVVKLAYQHAQNILAEGKPVQITCGEMERDRSILQNRYYWAACIREISEQARINGQRYTVDAWHELFKRQFLGFEVVKVEVAGRKRAVTIRRLRSTTALKVREMSQYLDEVQSFAAAELGVRFSVRNWQEHAGLPQPKEKAGARQEDAVAA
jgi:hypothetical protein